MEENGSIEKFRQIISLKQQGQDCVKKIQKQIHLEIILLHYMKIQIKFDNPWRFRYNIFKSAGQGNYESKTGFHYSSKFYSIISKTKSDRLKYFYEAYKISNIPGKGVMMLFQISIDILKPIKNVNAEENWGIQNFWWSNNL